MDRYQALSKMCLNNWHYINEKVLSFHDEVNFFTGHSGSGKSTVLDALQIVLYADSNGRSFFNKAAKEDSDRTLIEYLRGMKVVQENNEISYLRNKNFSTTLVLEFKDTETQKYQSLGVVFDVDVSVNEISRLFFWHTGELAPNRYRDDGKAFSISELKEYIESNYTGENYYFSRTNEKFRNELYANFFGGLHPKHFPALFKKAIPFKMDMKLEDFVKNYICTENDIHMEDMQDSVAQYTRLKRRLEDTRKEIALLTEIKEQYGRYEAHGEGIRKFGYGLEKLELASLEARLRRLQIQQTEYRGDMKLLENSISQLEGELSALQKERDEVVYAIQNSGYEHLEAELGNVNQMLELLYRSKADLDKTLTRLGDWLDTDYLEPPMQKTILRMKEYDASPEEVTQIQAELAQVRIRLEQERVELSGMVKEEKQKLGEVLHQTAMLQKGQKAYPAYLLEAKDIITRELEQIYGLPVRVDILADVIEIRNDLWRNAVEGYLGNNKLALIVPAEYARTAIGLFAGLDSKKYYKAAIVDTESVRKDARPLRSNSLAEEVEAATEDAGAYVSYLLGNVIKCNSVEELRCHKNSVTPDCMLYQGYRLQHMNPRNYTEEAYIGRRAIERRLEQLDEKLAQCKEQLEPLDLKLADISRLLQKEYLQDGAEFYVSRLEEVRRIQEKEAQREEYRNKIEELKERSLDEWKASKELLEQAVKSKSRQKEKAGFELQSRENALAEGEKMLLSLNEELLEKQKLHPVDEKLEEAYPWCWEAGSEPDIKSMEKLRLELQNQKQQSEVRMQEEYDRLLRKREQYHGVYAYRGFSLSSRENKEYDQLLESLSSDRLSEFTRKANEQAVKAVHHFKTDFVYKIRDAIKEVMQQKEDLNRILAQLDFGKDKYRFIITRNKGEDGKFYDMFMDENLEINPQRLAGNMNNQMDLFTLQHQKDYSGLIDELLELFMPPENSDGKALEEARANMEKYADYRTYLSFDMEQLVEGMPPMRLSRMLSKNSGGEGQNPLYVALLASFAQVYRINLKTTVRRRPTPRLVVLDEAFSKMDAEKVGSCIGLIRKLGFQAIISATNDKIQNYVDNVDKTFVFANPNKNRISVQEFERREFTGLVHSQEEEDRD